MPAIKRLFTGGSVSDSQDSVDGRDEGKFMTTATILRVARPTDNLADVVRFDEVGLGLTRLDSFADHAGFDGVMLGTPGSFYHLEFTSHRHTRAGRASTPGNLLVFYFLKAKTGKWPSNE